VSLPVTALDVRAPSLIGALIVRAPSLVISALGTKRCDHIILIISALLTVANGKVRKGATPLRCFSKVALDVDEAVQYDDVLGAAKNHA
jgi:hypothetical protein